MAVERAQRLRGCPGIPMMESSPKKAVVAFIRSPAQHRVCVQVRAGPALIRSPRRKKSSARRGARPVLALALAYTHLNSNALRSVSQRRELIPALLLPIHLSAPARFSAPIRRLLTGPPLFFKFLRETQRQTHSFFALFPFQRLLLNESVAIRDHVFDWCRSRSRFLRAAIDSRLRNRVTYRVRVLFSLHFLGGVAG